MVSPDKTYFEQVSASVVSSSLHKYFELSDNWYEEQVFSSRVETFAHLKSSIQPSSPSLLMQILRGCWAGKSEHFKVSSSPFFTACAHKSYNSHEFSSFGTQA